MNEQLTPEPKGSPKILVPLLAVLLILAAGIGSYFLIRDFDNLPWINRANKNITTGYTTYTGGAIPTVAQTIANQGTIGKIENLDQLRTFLQDHATSSYSSYAYDRGEMMPTPTMGTTFNLGTADLAAPVFGLGSSEEKSQGTSYSTTNVQVKGVDEGDIVKNDGKYVYAISGNNVFIMDAYPADGAKILSTIVFDSTPQNLYLNGKYLVVYGNESNISVKPFADIIRQNSSYTFFKVFDITDKANPRQVRDLEFEGWYSNSRMIGDYVYLVTSQPTYYMTDPYPLPMILEDEQLMPVDGSIPNCNCPDIYYVDVPYQPYNFTTVTAINVIDNEEKLDSNVYLINNTENMYVSEDNIYLVYTKYLSETQLRLEVLKEAVVSRLSAADTAKINEIQSVPSHILTLEEKTVKINQIVAKYVQSLSEKTQEALEDEVDARMKQKYEDISAELEKTVIHKININKNTLTYQGSGEVTGNVLNQFSMDEKDGNLRIATTKNRTWSSFTSSENLESYNNVYVLDKNLKVVGKVEKLAKGERIYSARFMQNRAYVVTFKQTDPLYVIDLTDPKNPAVLGELKVPGFSSYLHPYDDTTLIGFGKDATDTGATQGLKLSLYDVSDVNNLKEIDTYTMGESGSTSIALDDHKAFLFDKEKELLVVPVQLNNSAGYSYNYIQGAMVFKVTKDGFTFRKRIDHSTGADQSETRKIYGYSYYDETVKRSLYINDILYTLSDRYLKMNNLTNLEEVKTVNLKAGDSGDDYTVVR